MLYNSRFVLAKIEATYDTDSTPTNANTMLTTGLSIVPYGGATVSRDLDKPDLGASEVINVNPQVSLSFGVELAGSGAAGTPPAVDAVLRACGLTPTVATGTSVTYNPVSASFESVTCYFYLDAGVQRHVATGVRGNMGLTLQTGAIPLFNFDNLIGTYTTPTTVGAVTPDYTSFEDPVAVTYTNTGTVTLDSYAGCLQSFQCTLGNNVVRVNRPNCRQTEITDRSVSGTIVISAPSLATKNFFTKLESHAGTSTVPIVIEHGTVAGNIVRVELDTAQLTNLTEVDLDGTEGYSFDFLGIPSASGNDEIDIIFK